MSTDSTTKRHARTRRGCLTCRIRKKKCDSLRPSCTKCTRLHVQCLGYASDRPEWLKGDSAKLYTTAIKCFLSEYPAAKAYSDPVPFLVLKATPEVERWLAQDPGAFNPVCFDSESSTLKPWSPSMVAQPLTEPHGAAFPAAATGGEPAHASSYPMPETATRSHEPLTPSPQTDYIYPPSSHYPVHPVAQGTATQATWMYTPQDMTQSFPATPYVPSQQPLYDYSSQGIAIHNYYNHDEHVVHHVGPTGLARQGYHALAPGKTGFDAAGAPVMWMF